MKTLEEIREYISCPQLGDDHYGKWGALTLEQRKVIYDLINFVECDDLEITRLKQEKARLNKIIERLVNFNELVYKRYDRKIKDYPIRSIVKHNLEIIYELKEEGK